MYHLTLIFIQRKLNSVSVQEVFYGSSASRSFSHLCRVSQVKIVAVEKKINEIVNRLEKTKVERFPDLAAEKESRDREERNEKKAQLQEQKRREKEEQKKKKEMEDLRYVGSWSD